MQRVHTRIRRFPPFIEARTGLQVGLKTPGADVVGVAQLAADNRDLAADFTLLCHDWVLTHEETPQYSKSLSKSFNLMSAETAGPVPFV
jgi:hypothetical protein